MIEIVDGVVIGGFDRKVALCCGGEEIAVSSVESWGEAIRWGKYMWLRKQNEIGAAECLRLGWISAELRYYE